MEDCLQRRWDEVEALMAIYGGDGEFELLEGEPPGSEAGAGQLVFRLGLKSLPIPWSLLVTLPTGYPATERPSFCAEVSTEAGLPRSAAAALATAAGARLADAVLERDGEECIYEALQVLEGLEAELPLADTKTACVEVDKDKCAAWVRTIVRIDHMNDPRGYCRALEGFAAESRCLQWIVYREAQGRYRQIHLVLDAPSRAAAGEFLKKLRTQPVDVDGRGEPCKERCAEILEEFEVQEGSGPQRTTLLPHGSPQELEALLSCARAGAPDLSQTGWPGAGNAAGGGTAWACAAKGRGTLLTVAVRPGRRSTEITNLSELRCAPQTAALCADLHAQPREGEANEELLRLMAKTLRVPVASISLASGGKSRDKQLLVEGLRPEEVVTRIVSES